MTVPASPDSDFEVVARCAENCVCGRLKMPKGTLLCDRCNFNGYDFIRPFMDYDGPLELWVAEFTQKQKGGN